MQVRRREFRVSKDRSEFTRERIGWASATFLLLLVGTTFVMRSVRPSAQPPSKIVFTVESPSRYKPTPDAITALSPDGSQIAYAVVDAKRELSRCGYGRSIIAIHLAPPVRRAH